MKKAEVAKSLRSVLWIAILFAITALIIGAIERKEMEVISKVNVTVEPLEGGHYLINEDDIPVLIETRFAYPLTVMPVGQIDVERLERVLEEDPFVKAAQAYVDAQNQVHIQVEQRQPVLRVMDNNSLNYYLDAEGHQMPTSKHYAARVLVATGNLPPYVADFQANENNLLNHVFQLGELLVQDEFLSALVEQVYVNKRGELVLAPKVGKQTIAFGRYQNAENKLNRLKAFYREGLPYKGWNAYKSFDLRYNGQVVCTKR